MKIDFVIPWVDGNDEEWEKVKKSYQSDIEDDGNKDNRFRDWGLLPYWFRGVEKFAPWVNRIHFVTWGHIPEFLNTNHPKLHIVRHEDYLPDNYRPTFNANTIEMNFHRIPDLAEHFVYFNDDMYLIRPQEESDFFKDGIPCTCGLEEPLISQGADGIWRHLIVNDMRIINNHFVKSKQVEEYKDKYINRAYGKGNNIKTRLYEKMFPEQFVGFRNFHAPAAFLKSTYEEIWDKEYAVLDATSANHFRTNDDVNQWLILWWQIASGSFSPYMIDNIVEDATMESVDMLCDVISGQKHNMICVNDPSDSIDFDYITNRVKSAFDSILPEKSSFEK